MKIKLDNDFVTSLIGQWNSFIDSQNGDTTNFNTSLLNDNIRSTSRIVLSGNWAKANVISAENKNDLKGILKILEFKEKVTQGPASSDEISHYNSLIDRLVHLMDDPWPQEIKDVMENYKDIDFNKAQYFWKLEGSVILETRIENLLKAKLKCSSPILSLLKLLLLIWKGSCTCNSFQQFEESSNLLQHHQPEMCSLSAWDCSHYPSIFFYKYLDIFIVLLILEDKFDQLDEWVTAGVTIEWTIRLLEMPKEDRIAKIWNGWKELEKIRDGITNMAWRTTWRILKGKMSTSIDELKSLYHLIYFLSESDAIPKCESRLNVEIFSSLQEIPNIDHLYALTEYIYEKEVDEKYDAEKNKLFLGLLIRVLTEEINRIRTVEHQPEASKDIVRIKEMESHLSSKYILASDYLDSYPRTSWEFKLTAFSLNPTQEIYNQLFIENVQNIHTISELNSELETIKLPPSLIEDLTGVIKLGRISDLSWYPSLEVLTERCLKHIKLKGQEIRKRREELKNLNVDFSNYNGEDDPQAVSGYEKGYAPNDKRFQKVKRVRGPYKKKSVREKTDFEINRLKRKVKGTRGPYKKRLKTDFEINGLKRKVGRPKKLNYETSGPSTAVMKFKWVRLVIDSQGRVIQRGRGRPKNSDGQETYRVVMKKICINSNVENIIKGSKKGESQNEKEFKILDKVESNHQTKGGRGRGRPKRILTENENSNIISLSTSSSVSITTDGRNKNITENIDKVDSNHQTKGRKRGRPKRILIENENSNVISLSNSSVSTTTDGKNKNITENIDPEIIFQKIINIENTSSNFDSKYILASDIMVISDSDTSTSSNPFLDKPCTSTSTTMSPLSSNLSENMRPFILKKLVIPLKRIDAYDNDNNQDSLSDDVDDSDSDSSSSSNMSFHSNRTTLVSTDDEDESYKEQTLNEITTTEDGYADSGPESDSDDELSMDSDCQIIYEKPPPEENESDFDVSENSSLESINKGSCSSVSTATFSYVPEKKMSLPLPLPSKVLLNNNNTAITNQRLQLLMNSLNIESDNDNSNSTSKYVSYIDSSSDSDSDDEENPEIVDIC